jgi:hypothetical protein
MRFNLSFLALALVAAPAMAQQHDDHDRAVSGGGMLPPGWTARTDNAGPLTNLKYAVMTPGWHLTTGPAVILYRDADRAEGAVHAVSKIHLFPSSGHAEGFGLFLGGQNLKEANQAYTYFLIRGDGKYLIKRRNGTNVSTLVDWTDSDAINKQKTDGPVANELSFEVGRDSVGFMVNGKTVHTTPVSEADTKGIVGLRVNHNLDLHVETLGVHPR